MVTSRAFQRGNIPAVSQGGDEQIQSFGFIQPQDGSKDVFVHITAVQAAGLKGLNDGQKVTYDVVTERGKLAATNLQLG